jgi:predicted aldo/keto reductase-like oxidoreductase
LAQLELPRRPFGRTGLTVASLGLSGSFGIDADTTERAFHELSINHFFVTPRMPKLVEGLRRLIKAGHRDELVLQSGAWLPTGGGVESGWESAAKALGTDRIDVFQVFWVRWHWYLTGRTVPALRRLHEQGKIRAACISTHQRTLGLQLAGEFDLDVLMLRYNAAHRGAEREVFDRLPEPRPGIVAYTATRWGRLLKPQDGLGPLTAPECYRFQLSHPKVDVALCGAKTWDELVTDARGVLAGPLDERRMGEARAFGDAVHRSVTGRFGFG